MAETASTPVTSTTSTPAQAQNTAQNSPQTPSSPPTSSGGNAGQPAEMFEVKVNGRTVKMTRQEVLDHASMSHAANDKFNEASKLRKEHDNLKQRAQKDFIEFLQDPALGLSKDQIRDRFEKWYAKEFIEPESMSAEQRKMRELEDWKNKREAEDNERKVNDEKQANEKLTVQQRDHLQNQIIEALDKSNLPKTKGTVARMAFYMRQNLLNGWDAPMDMIVKQVQNERQQSFRDEMGTSSVQQVIELMGEDFVNKIRKHDLEALRQRRAGPPVDTGYGYSAQKKQEKEPEKIYSSEVTRRLRDMRLGKI